jgi:TetR/AcrR family transcriptional repressor of nem operon
LGKEEVRELTGTAYLPVGRSQAAVRILDAAERLVQTQGFNGFSYADIAAELTLTKAALHYHFPTKGDLGRALIDRYTEVFGQALSAIATSHGDAPSRLISYARVYEDVLTKGRICLCGMLAAEYATLPKVMQNGVRAFFDANEVWLSGVLEQGRLAGELTFEGSPQESARLITAALEGSMLLARSFDDSSRLAASARRIIETFFPPHNGLLPRSTARNPRPS